MRNLKKEDIVWTNIDNETGNGTAIHGYYSTLRKGPMGEYFCETHNGNSALCNKKFGVSEDGEIFLTIEKLEGMKFDPNLFCQKCVKIYNSLPKEDKIAADNNFWEH